MKKIIVTGVIALFIFVGLQPAFAVEPKLSTDNTKIEGCRECNGVSDADLSKVKGLLDRIEKRTKLLLVLSKNNPEIKENYENLADIISQLNTLDLKESICKWLSDIIIDIMFNKLGYYFELAYEYFMQFHFLLAFFTFGIILTYTALWALTYMIYLYVIKCGDYPFTNFLAKEYGGFIPYLKVEYGKIKNYNIQNQFFLPIPERFPLFQQLFLFIK